MKKLPVVARLLITAGVVSAGTMGVVAGFVRLLSAGRIVSIDQVPKLPVALVLGAQVHPGQVPSTFLKARLDLAAQLFARGLVERVLVSGDGVSPDHDEPQAMKAYLVDRGVPAEVIMVDPLGVDTFSSCLEARDRHDCRQVVIVSQSYHLPRAVAIATLLDLDAWGVGDRSVRRLRRLWNYGVLREAAANLKVVSDLFAQRFEDADR